MLPGRALPITALFLTLVALVHGGLDPTILLNDGTYFPYVSLGGGDKNNVTAAEIVLAVEAGFRGIDTAFDYFDETGVATGINEVIASGKVTRKDLYVTTKVPGCLTQVGCRASVLRNHASNLKQLGLESVNMLLVHFSSPTAKKCDCDIITEEWSAVVQLQASGATTSIGVSNYCQACIECLAGQKVQPAVNQIQYHVGMGGDPEQLKSFCKSKGIVAEAYSPLGPTFNETAKKVLIEGPLTTGIGKHHNKSGAQVALKWIVQHGSPLTTRASSLQYLSQDMDLFDWNLTSAELAQLDAATDPFAKPCLFCTGP